MAKLLVTYYSRTGNTKKMAEVIARAARGVKGVEVALKPIEDVTPKDLLGFDGILIGSPVYYGTMAAEVKQLLDESVAHHGKLEGKVGGAFASSGGPGGGNETTVLDIVKALLIHGMIVRGDPQGDHYGPIAVGAPDERSRKECRRFGRRNAELAKRLLG
ncbi:MAG: NAD(P)H-dependent oxidoreductase [Armatimonadota bacterium]|nr:MAG: NAD(P)H-dependent oxidoreductase [Armatimonadota bacterium]